MEYRQKMSGLGFGMGMPGYWARIVTIQRSRITESQEVLATESERVHSVSGTGYEAMLEGVDVRISVPARIGSDGLLAIMAAKMVLDIVRQYRKLHPADPEIHKALDVFEKAFPDLTAARDLLMHVDDYLVGDGKLSYDVNELNGPRVDFPSGLRGDPEISFGPFRFALYALCDATAELAAKADDWWSAQG